MFPFYSSYSDSSSLSLALDIRTAGTLTITVTVINVFQKEASCSTIISLNESRALTLQLDTGPKLAMTTQDQGQVLVQVTDSCGLTAGTRSYHWKILSVSTPLSDSDPDPSLVLQASNSPSVLYIRKNSLAAGHSYLYEVVVTQGDIQGSTTLTVTVLPSNLVLRLNRMSGSHPSDMILKLDGSLSTDPDKSTEIMGYRWICNEAAELCKDAAGDVLVTNANADVQVFQPDKLRHGAVYNFTLSISKDTRKAAGYVVMTIVPPIGCNVALKPLSSKINSGYPFSIIPEISTDLEIDFRWRQTAGRETQPTNSYAFAYITFRADALIGGERYAFELTAKRSKAT